MRLAPNDADGYRGLSLAYEKQGKTHEAMEALQHYLKLGHSSRDRQLVARRLYHLAHPADGATP